MALTTPILYSIPAFDAQNSFEFQFASIGGNQVVANTLTIKNNATLTTVYSVTQTTFKFEHTLPANTLTNGTYYQATLTTKDAQGNESNASSPIQFYCYSQPSFEITNMPNGNVIQNSSFAFEVTYNQKQGEILNAYVFNLYSASGALISTSNTVYNTDTTLPLVVSYLFSGFEDKASYSIEVTGVTANGTEITTGKINFTTDYIKPDNFSYLFLTNNCKGGYVTIKSNVVSIDGESNPETPTYINDEEIDLTGSGNYVEWNKGYSINNDWTMRFWGRKYTPNTEIFRFSNTNGDNISINYCTKKKTIYTWKKYSVGTTSYYKAVEEANGTFDKPSDANGEYGYEGYELNSQTGEFTLTGVQYTTSTVPSYFSSSSKNKIYKYEKVVIVIFGQQRVFFGYNAINAVQDSKSGQGDTYYGTVTSDSKNSYPANGEQNGYWYVFDSSVESGTECWFELKVLHNDSIWGYVTESEHIAMPSDTEQVFCWLRRVNNLYELKIENRGVVS